MSGTPAEVGGLREGDVIIEFNGHTIERSGELPQHVGRVRAGTEVEVRLVRDGKEMTLDLEVGELSQLAGRPGVLSGGSSDDIGRLGLRIAELNDNELNALEIEGGVRVEESTGAAADAGIRPRDVILRLNNRAVTSRADLEEITSDLTPGRQVPVLVLRNRNPVFLPLRVPE